MKILYVMHIPWSWIKQRPHFIAEGLAKYNVVTVFDKMAFKKKNKVDNQSCLKIRHLFRIPGERIPLISYISNFLMGMQLKFYMKHYECIWITDPLMYNYISNNVSINQKVVFDCMDDYLAFPMIASNKKMQQHYMNCENKLIHRSNLIIASSNYLRTVLSQRQSINAKKIHVVNNALTKEWVDSFNFDERVQKDIRKINSRKKIIIFIGTISEWFDFDLLKKSLKDYPNIEYKLYGPCDVRIPRIKGISYMGIIEHRDVPSVIKHADMLIMPFKLIMLVLSVNPVKLYEYILSDRPVVAVNYEESRIFQEYIYLYNDYQQYSELIELLLQNKLYVKKTKKEVYQFLLNNTWNARMKVINQLIRTM